jgi:hypothetical protein
MQPRMRHAARSSAAAAPVAGVEPTQPLGPQHSSQATPNPQPIAAPVEHAVREMVAAGQVAPGSEALPGTLAATVASVLTEQLGSSAGSARFVAMNELLQCSMLRLPDEDFEQLLGMGAAGVQLLQFVGARIATAYRPRDARCDRQAAAAEEAAAEEAAAAAQSAAALAWALLLPPRATWCESHSAGLRASGRASATCSVRCWSMTQPPSLRHRVLTTAPVPQQQQQLATSSSTRRPPCLLGCTCTRAQRQQQQRLPHRQRQQAGSRPRCCARPDVSAGPRAQR